MSLILDALKKMEQEKVRRHAKSVELGSAIFQERTPARGSRWRTPTLLAGAVVTTAASMYLFMNSGSGKTPKPPVEPAPVVQAAPSPPPYEPAPPATIEPLQPAPLPPAQAPAPLAAPPAMPVPSPSVTAAAQSDLVVNGIAWQEERSGRRAVVNGLLVAEGDTVAGFRIRQIHPDKVIFNSGGYNVEIMHSTPLH
jgi:general secretion pathway protein B